MERIGGPTLSNNFGSLPKSPYASTSLYFPFPKGGELMKSRFMTIKLSPKPKQVPNQKPNDIIKRSYAYEKKMQKEWELLLRRIFND